ncbi:phosphoenolpyruvate--protein phosphotransferase [Bacteroidetes/Chlorobi group bacterium Naka2016]|jgi:phosphotransferase system enzyme I (PtsI)|nr:MAG: phosphoenolpyruvate--protein phosphotransferase [Bacteroidetes/Chlorobi group bacterium Naka2016]
MVMAKTKYSLALNETVLKGIPASKGYAIGKAFIIKDLTFNNSNHTEVNTSNEDELKRFFQTIEEYENELVSYSQKIDGQNPVALDMIESIKLILHDPDIHENVKRLIDSGKSAEYSVLKTFQKFENQLLLIKSKLIRERALELSQIRNRLLELLINKKLTSSVPEGSVVVASSLSADQVIAFKEKKVAGFIIEMGGVTTHCSILARSFRIPSVISVPNATKLLKDGDKVLIDGFKGIIIVNPTEKTLEDFKAKIEDESQIQKELGEILYLPTQTKDGTKVELQANLNFRQELDEPELYHSDGIGLVRTEHLVPINEFYNHEFTLDEFEQIQYEIYSEVAVKMYPKVVTFRAFDLGGDKFPSLFAYNEANPMLGFRGIRYLLANRAFFKAQLRAFLKASIEKNIQIMLPMITTVEEIVESLKLLNECKEELTRDGFEFDSDVKFGIMIETPAAALQTRVFAKYVDFFSIGTNDLTQYTLVADRDNSHVSSYFSPFHPSVLALMKFTIDEAKRYKKKVGICGELASHPAAASILVGLGFDTISVSIPNLLQVKKWISEIDSNNAKKLLKKALKFETAEEVSKFLDIE